MESFVNVPMRSWRHDQTITIAAPGQAIRTTGLSDCHAMFVASRPNASGRYRLIGVHLTGGVFDARLAFRLLEASDHGPALVFYVEGVYRTPVVTRSSFEQLKMDLGNAARALHYVGPITVSHFACPQSDFGDVEVTPTAQINFPET